MILCEEADYKLMHVSEILVLRRVASWPPTLVLLHPREEVIYQP